MRRILLLSMVACLLQCYSLGQVSCSTYAYQQQQFAANPQLVAAQHSVEAFIQHQHAQQEIIAGAEGNINNAALPVITIPVVVHVVYNSAEQNISDAQVRSQIDVLNQDFRRLNADTTRTPSYFRSVAADCYIEFQLAKVDPQGYATSGIVRKKTSVSYFSYDDKIKFTATGGDDGWNSDKYLNIWVGNLTSGLIGYASIIGNDKTKDGVVIRYTAFGTTGKLQQPYIKGRTTTHEIGHWLGLKHIWGDMYCGDDDVDDTPPQSYSTRGCPDGIVISCNNAPYGNMYMDYMDLTSDACMNMFTAGQRARMRALFDEGGPRHALLSSDALTATPLPAPIGLPDDNGSDKLVNIYPNPVNTNVTIDIKNDAYLIGQYMTIYNQLGQQVKQVQLLQTTTQLNVSSLRAGIYFVRVGNGRQSYKLIKGESQN